MIRALILGVLLAFCAGCEAPPKVAEDIALIQNEEAKMYEFNQELLKRLKTSTPEEIQRKIDLLTISRIAHHRVKTATNLLAEYLQSTEYLRKDDIDALATLMKKIQARMEEKE